MTNIRFEWNVRKELENIRKHGFSFDEAIEVFADHYVLHVEDSKHSSEEDRYYAVGRTRQGVILTVRYTLRGHVIRIFGAAKWRKWEEHYEAYSRSKKDETN